MCETPQSGERLCRHCAQPIATQASVCHHCSKHQKLIWAVIERIGIIGSLLLIVLAFLQFAEARHERVKAQSALSEAQQARAEARAALAQAQQTAERNARTEEDLRQQVLSVTKMFYLQVVTRNDFTAERGGKAAKEILQELNRVLPRVLPDPQQRSKCINELYELMPRSREEQLKKEALQQEAGEATSDSAPSAKSEASQP